MKLFKISGHQEHKFCLYLQCYIFCYSRAMDFRLCWGYQSSPARSTCMQQKLQNSQAEKNLGFEPCALSHWTDGAFCWRCLCENSVAFTVNIILMKIFSLNVYFKETYCHVSVCALASWNLWGELVMTVFSRPYGKVNKSEHTITVFLCSSWGMEKEVLWN